MGADSFFAFWDADSLFKLGADLESLFILVPTLGNVADPGVPRVYVKGVGKTRISKNAVFYSVFWARLRCTTWACPGFTLEGVGKIKI